MSGRKLLSLSFTGFYTIMRERALMRLRPLSRSARVTWLLASGACLCSVVALFGNYARNRSILPSDSLRAVFADFTFVGQNSCQEVEYRPHGTSRLPAPRDFQEGVCYVYLFPSGSDRPVYELIEQRLGNDGVAILHSPSIDNDLIHLVIGGPLVPNRIPERTSPWRHRRCSEPSNCG